MTTRLAAAILAALLALPGAAIACDSPQLPSPRKDDAPAGIRFINDSMFAMQVYWADFDGELEARSDWVQPGEDVGFSTQVGHRWYVAVNTPEGQVCSGAIWAAEPGEDCTMRILYEDGIGYDAGYCDFD